MSDVNPKNYDGSYVSIVGRAGGPMEIKEFSNGNSQAQLSVAVGKGYKKDGEWIDTGTDWYTLTATQDYAEDNWPEVGKGDKVRIDDARLELKPYNTKKGEAAVEATLRFGTLVVLEAKSDRPAKSDSPWG
jgi:single-stranded DNA-binding protein